MIRFDGYYIFEPIPYQERGEWSPDYSNKAYLFQKNGIVKVINRWSKKRENILFSINDFNDKFGEYLYEVRNSKMFLINKSTNSDYKIYYDLISSNEIKHRDSGDIMRFVPWDNN